MYKNIEHLLVENKISKNELRAQNSNGYDVDKFEKKNGTFHYNFRTH